MRAPFIDASAILDSYELIQNPNEPSRLIRKRQVEGQKKRVEADIEANYNSGCKFYHYDNRKVKAQRGLTEQWGEAVWQLSELIQEVFDASHLNPKIEPTTKRAILSALNLLVKVFSSDNGLPCPDVVPNGEGGIDIEWEFENRYISVQIHKSDAKKDKLFYRLGNSGFKSTNLDLNSLVHLIRQ